MPDDSFHVGAIVGSLRKDSFNRTVFNAAAQIASPSLTVTEIPIGNLPFFNQDEESNPVTAVDDFWQSLDGIQALLVFTPEYNWSIPGVLKNALDWASRPPRSSHLAEKPAAILGAAIGRSGTMRAQIQLRTVLTCLGMRVMPKPDFFLPFAGKVVNDDAMLSDPAVEAEIAQFLESFADWIVLASANGQSTR